MRSPQPCTRAFAPAAAALLGALLLSLASCTRPRVPALPREELFSIGLGRLEDQIDLFMPEDRPTKRRNLVYLKGGRIYIVNGSASKIMEFTPYGALVFLLYDPRENPRPVILSDAGGAVDLPNRRAVSYTFNDPGLIAVDGEKRLYVEDRLDASLGRLDETTGLIHCAHILRFDRDGHLLDYLGQEGVRGTPFPFVEALRVTERDEVVVVCRVSGTRRLVYWFAPEGSLLYRLEIDSERLPVPEGTVASVEAVFAGYTSRELLLAANIYREEINPTTKTSETWQLAAQRIYRLDLASGRYTASLEVPGAGTRQERVGAAELEIPAPPYELLGNTRSGHFVLLRPESSNSYELLVLDGTGRAQARRMLAVEEEDLTFKSFALSEEGTLVALLGLSDGARMVWWRTDGLLEGRGNASR